MHPTRSVIALTALIFAVTLEFSACGDRSAPGTLKHNTNEPVRHEAKAWLWADDSVEEYLAMGNPSDPTSLKGPKTFLAPDHAVTKRLQAWIDELDSVIRTQDPERMAMVPKPTIHIEITDDVNAFVTAIPVCFDNVSLRFNGSQNSGTRASEKFLALFEDGHFYGGPSLDGQSPDQSKECRHSKISLAELRERLDTLNAVNRDCQLSAKTLSGASAAEDEQAQYEVIANKGCVVTGSLENASGASVLAFMATSRHVTIFSGLIRSLGEAETVSVLAHELGHYYRPHIASGDGHYNFAYDASGFNPSARPNEKSGTSQLRDSGNKSRSIFGVMQARVSDLLENIPATALSDIEEAKLHPVSYPTLHELVSMYSTSSAASCDDAAKMQERLTNHGIFDLKSLAMPLHKLDAASTKALIAWETKAITCLKEIKIDDDAIMPNPVEAVESATASYKLARAGAKPIPTSGTMADWLEQIDRSIRDAYRTQTFETATPFNVHNIQSAQRKIIQEYVASQSQASELKTKKLGLYTVEQEADELAAEWMHSLGFDPKTPGNVDMAFIKLFESDDAYNACNAQRLAGWKDGQESALFVAWSDLLLDPHPASCFRVRDQDLEATAHNYKNPSGGPRQVPPKQEWKDLIATIPSKNPKTLSFAAHNVGAYGGLFKHAKTVHCRFDLHL
jgi:Zn-dependent protease with chaperone function